MISFVFLEGGGRRTPSTSSSQPNNEVEGGWESLLATISSWFPAAFDDGNRVAPVDGNGNDSAV